MAIVGFSFTKINAEKKNQLTGKVDINNNVSIKSVKEADLALGKGKDNALKFTFDFTSKFEPNVGVIQFEGEIVFMEQSKKIKEIQSSWKDDKKIPKDVMTHILNAILNKCNVKALIISQDINLPPPIPLPKVQIGDNPE